MQTFTGVDEPRNTLNTRKPGWVGRDSGANEALSGPDFSPQRLERRRDEILNLLSLGSDGTAGRRRR